MTSAGGPRVFIAASNALYAAGLVDFIERSFECVGWTTSVSDVLDVATEREPDIVILDAEIANTHLPTLCRRLRQGSDHLRILVIGDRGVGGVPLTVIRSGIDGYLFKDCDSPDLVRAIQAISRGELYFPLPVASAIVRHLRLVEAPGQRHAAKDSLTERETHVIELMATGANNREIARKLSVSERTVENHNHNLYRKLGVHDRAEAILVALRRGHISLFADIAVASNSQGEAATDQLSESSIAT